MLAPAPDGTPAERDFIDGALNRCSITHSVFATVVAYRRDAFPGRRPTSIADLFDQQRFPGPRALQRTPAVNLEWALLSYGVPKEEIYRLLSTRRGLSLAFERIDSLENLHWWEAGDTPVRLLAENEVVMASGYNGRFFDAMINRDLPIEILWDGQVQEHETWAVPRHAAHPDIARDFIRFATSSERQAALARLIPYGPSRRSATLQVTTHPDSGVDMRLHIPTHPLNTERAITKDDDWYARSHTRINDYFRDALLDDREDSGTGNRYLPHLHTIAALLLCRQVPRLWIALGRRPLLVAQTGQATAALIPHYLDDILNLHFNFIEPLILEAAWRFVRRSIANTPRLSTPKDFVTSS
ncbi:hypothetical protein A8U91_00246 [Halomonas elongata]|uniref:Bacterial extracellular solute-binding protein n=1 Tax=Halomonas elongata TaxID=2746 RepID=A0A1B8P0Z8_HALEL|nr:extracellular solute-binding protein [Halomonas elongata]OBX35910.1 hypothetical protein A8U91_00246 [Halomonas elongata]